MFFFSFSIIMMKLDEFLLGIKQTFSKYKLLISFKKFMLILEKYPKPIKTRIKTFNIFNHHLYMVNKEFKKLFNLVDYYLNYKFSQSKSFDDFMFLCSSCKNFVNKIKDFLSYRPNILLKLFYKFYWKIRLIEDMAKTRYIIIAYIKYIDTLITAFLKTKCYSEKNLIDKKNYKQLISIVT